MSGWEWPRWFRWTIRGIAVLIILYFGLAVGFLIPVNTAGNVALRFIADLEPLNQADIEMSFATLCESEQERIGVDAFVDTRGAEYSALGNFGVVGAATQYPETDTLQRNITEAWVEFDVTKGNVIETWRLYMIRERDWWEWKGDWKVCGIEFRGERPA
jgi:hypothetical protein